MSEPERTLCPACGKPEGVPIVWGLVVPPDFRVAEPVIDDPPDVAYGGCCMPVPTPNTRCRACGHDWTTR